MARADTTSPWISGTPVYEHITSTFITNSTENDAFTLLRSYRMGCAKEDFTTRPKRSSQTSITKTVCSNSMLGGRVSNDLLLKNGTSVAGTVAGSTNTNSIVKTIPSSDMAIELTSAQQIGYYVWPLEHAYVRAATITDASGMVTYKMPAATSGSYIKNANNQPVLADPNTINFSDNGEWMIADAPGTGFVRINLASKQVLPFASSLSGAYDKSIPTINAISGDGRYAVISSSNTPQVFTLYDLATCTPPTSGLLYNCQKRDLNTIMADKVLTWRKVIGNMRFASNNTLYFYGGYDFISGLNQKWGLFSLATPGTTASKLDYLALGDSFSSGEGIYNYLDTTDFTDNRCHLSELSYPYILRKTISSIGGFQSVACSGAKTKDIITASEDNYNKNNSQSRNKYTDDFDSEIYSYYLPGYRVQNNFVVDNKPKIITMSIGGNDIGFSSILQNCVLSIGDCYYFYEESAELVSNINNAYQPLLDTYRKIKDSSATDTKIYIVGYPQIAQPNGNCGLNVHFTNNEILLGQQLIKHLNLVIKTAADHAGVAYIDVEDAFDGHKLCEASGDDLAVNGIIASNPGRVITKKPAAAESYHPNELGHKLLAAAISDATNNFTITMPSPSNDVVTFDDATKSVISAGKPLKSRALYATTYNDSITLDTLLKNQSSEISVNAYEYSLKPNTSYNLAMYSELTDLGTVTTDELGNINASFTVPSSIEPGYHSLHVRGVNVLNEPIDIMKLVYVAASADDFDGDGIVNTDETCLLIESLGIDYDKDGVDDACDGAIGEPPVVSDKPALMLANAEQTPKGSKLVTTSSTQSQISMADQSSSQQPSNQPTLEITQDDTTSDKSTKVAGVSTKETPQTTASMPTNKNNPWIFIVPVIVLLLVASGYGIFVLVKE